GAARGRGRQPRIPPRMKWTRQNTGGTRAADEDGMTKPWSRQGTMPTSACVSDLLCRAPGGSVPFRGAANRGSAGDRGSVRPVAQLTHVDFVAGGVVAHLVPVVPQHAH